MCVLANFFYKGKYFIKQMTLPSLLLVFAMDCCNVGPAMNFNNAINIEHRYLPDKFVTE